MIRKPFNSLRLSVLLLIGLWFTPATLTGSEPFDDTVYDPIREYVQVDLPKLKKNPKTYKNTDVKFRVYFHKIDDIWSPFFSPFSPSEYVSFAAWDHEKNLWKKKDMVDDFPFLYIKNGNLEIDRLLTADKYDLLELKGTVVSAFKSRPWIEVRHVEVLQENTFTDEQLSKLMLANEANRNEQPTLATQYFEEGLKKKELPPKSRAEVHKQLAINYFQASNYQKAIDNAYQYRSYAQEKDSMVENILKESQKLRGMSAEERNEYEKKRLQSKPTDETGLLSPEIKEKLDDPSQLKSKYQTLLSRYERLLGEHQTLKSEQKDVREQNRRLVRNMKKTKKAVEKLKQTNKELEQKLAEAYQKNARLLARLHGKTDEASAGASSSSKNNASSQEKQQVQAGDGSTGNTPRKQNEDHLREKKLLSKIRTLKRRNRSLRSQMSSLTTQNRKAQLEIERLRDQVNLKTSAVDTEQTEKESTRTEQKSEATGSQG